MMRWSLTILHFYSLQDALQLDSVKARLVTANFRADASLYRFMTTVEAGTCVVIIDPTAVLVALTNAQTPECSHDNSAGSEEKLTVAQHVVIDDFDRMLDTWKPSLKRPGTTIEMSRILDTHFKVNAALSLSKLGCTVRPHSSSCCMSCAIAGILSLGKRDSPRIINKAVPVLRRLGMRDGVGS